MNQFQMNDTKTVLIELMISLADDNGAKSNANKQKSLMCLKLLHMMFNAC